MAWEFSSYTFEETLQKRVTIIKAENTTTELTLNFIVQAVLPNVTQPANIFADYTFGRLSLVSLKVLVFTRS